MKRAKILILLSLLIFHFGCTNHQPQKGTTNIPTEIYTSDNITLTETESGKVAGYIENGIYTYKGIPYAKAERFMPPQQADKWQGIRSSRAYGPTCPQGKRMGWYSDQQAFAFDWDDGFSDEDCLRVNIWTQGIKSGKKRPVMVWLHGGGYSSGSGQELPAYDGAALCQKGDVVVVSLNHRLNVLGFLDLSAFGEKYASSGNVGLLDIVAALTWVKNNIQNFGGDASNVTIFGQSGGGGKVSTLMVTPAAKGLFQKAIVQSGSLLQLMEAKYSRKIGCEVMEQLNLNPSQIDQLRQIPYTQLLEVGNKAVQKIKTEAREEGFNPSIFGWAPTVDGIVLPYQGFDLHGLELSKNIPLLLGTTQHEFTASAYNPALREIDMDFAKTELSKKYGEKTDDFLDAFAKAYPHYRPQDIFDVDFIFRPLAVKHANLKSSQNGAAVYTYLFTWESPVLNGIFRSTHCMELPFVFNNIPRCRKMTGGGTDAIELAEKMSSAWLNFAKTGDPNTEELPTWEPYTIKKGATLFFDNNCELKYNHDKDLLELANLFPFKGF